MKIHGKCFKFIMVFFLLKNCVKYILNQFTLYKTFSHLYLARVKSYCYYCHRANTGPTHHGVNVNVPVHDTFPLKVLSSFQNIPH